MAAAQAAAERDAELRAAGLQLGSSDEEDSDGGQGTTMYACYVTIIATNGDDGAAQIFSATGHSCKAAKAMAAKAAVEALAARPAFQTKNAKGALKGANAIGTLNKLWQKV